jgi:hypothetical protein
MWPYIEWYRACCGEMHVTTKGRKLSNYDYLTIASYYTGKVSEDGCTSSPSSSSSSSYNS